MFGLGLNELLIILVIVLVLFGATRVPQLMKGIGTGMKEFKQAMKDDEKPADSPETTSSEKEQE